MEPPEPLAGKNLRVGLGLVEAHGRLVDQLDAAQELHVHVALVAGQQEAHRIAVAGHDPFAVLVERDHRIVEALLDRNAAVQGTGIAAFGEEPLGLRIDADLVEQRRKQNAGPFRVGGQPVQRLRGHLHWLRGEHRCRVAAALDEPHARDHGVAVEVFEREDLRLPHHAVDHQAMLGGVDIRNAGVVDGEVQRRRRDAAVDQMMRRAGVRVARLIVGI